MVRLTMFNDDDDISSRITSSTTSTPSGGASASSYYTSLLDPSWSSSSNAAVATNPMLRQPATTTTTTTMGNSHSATSTGVDPNNDNIYIPPLLHPQETYTQRMSGDMTPEKMAALKGPKGPKYTVLVTGAAGFVGMHTAIALKKIGMNPIAYDNVNQYYSVQLKESRIRELEKQGIVFVRGDVCNVDLLKEIIKRHDIARFIHLAAQAGVRYSLDHPLEYTRNNVDCTVNILEVMVELGLKNDPLVYASSSSVYGNNRKIPFQETDRVEDPASLYAATKRSDELIAHTYFNLHGVPSIGLRFFTVYGPYGRYVEQQCIFVF
jgi:GDP-mannose 4,6 dehydratase